MAPAPTQIPTPTPTPAPVPAPAPTPTYANAIAAGVTLAAPKVLGPDEASRALGAFRASCSVLTWRGDRSGLAQPGDWRGVCAEAAALNPEYAPGFFYYRFDWVRVGDGKAFATGYYEPEIKGSRVKAPGFEVPIYRTPADLTRCYGASGTGRGRVDHEGHCVL